MAKKISKNSGFTFVEMLLTIFIIGVISGVTAKVLLTGLDVYSLLVNRDNAMNTAREVMDRMFEEILLVETDDIISIHDNSFNFKDTAGVHTNFRRKIVQGSPTISRKDDFMAGNLAAIDFDYKHYDGSSTLLRDEVRRINIDFTLTAPADAGSIHLRTEVFPRSLMYDNFR